MDEDPQAPGTPRLGPYATLVDGRPRLTDEGREVSAAYAKRYPRPAMIVRRLDAVTWHLMTADGYLRPDQDAHDADGAALLGVVAGVQHYRPEVGAKLTTYVPWYVLTAVQRHYCCRTKREYPKAFFRSLAGAVRLDGRTNPDPADDRLVSDRQDPPARPDATAEHAEAAEYADWLLRRVHPRDAEVARRRFGAGRAEETQRVIARALGVKPQRVSQILARALQGLRAAASTTQQRSL